MKNMKRFLPLCAVLLVPAMLSAQVIVDDSWADGGRNNGADALDTDWWASTATSAIEVGSGFLGLVTGTSGRGIHGTFTPQALNIGDTLTATFSFTTPATVGSVVSTGFRIGYFDTTGKPGLAADITASSGSPNAIYNNLSGYMFDWDVNLASGNNTQFRERTLASSGQLLAQTGDYSNVGSGGGINYAFAANTAYVGVFSITRTGASSLDLTATLFQGATELTTHTATDTTASTTTFGMLAFHVNSNTFGSSAAINTPDNGIDFSNIKIELIPVPEPSSFALLALGAGGWLLGRRRMV
jgi:hypothetical protein